MPMERQEVGAGGVPTMRAFAIVVAVYLAPVGGQCSSHQSAQALL
jgi:hypothetical protein